MISSVIWLIEVEGCTNRQVDRRSVGCRTRVEAPAGYSPLDVDLLSGFGKRPE